jgi:hypothetical protein
MKPLYIIVIVCVLGWLAIQTFQSQRFDPNAVPRSIEARGDLAGDEQTTIEIFRNAAPSVVYITSIAVRRDFFSLNVYEIPRGQDQGLSGINRGGW